MNNAPPAQTFLAAALAAARETRTLRLGAGEIRLTAKVFREHFGDRPALLVAAPQTLPFATQVLAAFAAEKQRCLPTCLLEAPGLSAEFPFVTQVQEALVGHEAIPVAVGSGTINDLVKLASFRAGRPYMCVATAASMDGYTAFGASITLEGSKQTFACPAPVAVIADLEVIRSAPAPMAAAGYADLISKVTAGADWILADALGVEALDPMVWEIAQGRLRHAVGDPAGVRAGTTEALLRLTEGLMLGGFAMQRHQSSRPASGAEHQFSHLWDMQHHTYAGAAPPHGFKVGIATLMVTALYEHLLRQPLSDLDIAAACARWPTAGQLPALIAGNMQSEELARVGTQETAAKYVPVDAVGQQLERWREVWPELQGKLRRQLLPFEELKQMLAASGAPVEPEAIGISRVRLRQSAQQAYFIRRRFTVLDLLVRSGYLASTLDAVFGPDGVWPVA